MNKGSIDIYIIIYIHKHKSILLFNDEKRRTKKIRTKERMTHVMIEKRRMPTHTQTQSEEQRERKKKNKKNLSK